MNTILAALSKKLRNGAFAVCLLTPELYLEFFQTVHSFPARTCKFRVYGGTQENSLHVALRRPGSVSFDMRKVNVFLK
jgi:hypothetical protein